MPHTVRIWDLPLRLFHWALAAGVIGLVITAKLGGNAMVWHFRLGYLVLSLLLFRGLWGLIGGRWARFSAFIYSPQRTWRYLKGQGRPEDSVGHSPLAALSVFALLGILALQAGSGLLTDDEIAFAGPLTRLASGTLVEQATTYHKAIGQYLLLGMVALHLLAIAGYVAVKKQALVRPMVTGDKAWPHPLPASRDDTALRLVALGLWAACAALVWWISELGTV
ncbi:MAG: cytochrome b/b6 domain-containing protein [Burkholderiaceae bacterium]|nr:cytochrome b/b6 domain-containing protein [Burkholderiaceae bacterium]